MCDISDISDISNMAKQDGRTKRTTQRSYLCMYKNMEDAFTAILIFIKKKNISCDSEDFIETHLCNGLSQQKKTFLYDSKK